MTWFRPWSKKPTQNRGGQAIGAPPEQRGLIVTVRSAEWTVSQEALSEGNRKAYRTGLATP
jgi:hypothetical protein